MNSPASLILKELSLLDMTRLVRCIALAAPLIAVLVALPAWADPVEDFYRGKQIRIVIRAAPGGNYDLYSRLLIRHMVRFIPGHPTAMPVNMPGGSGLTALNYVADVHPRDGTVLTMVTQTFPLEQALGLNDKLKIDMRALNWIGNMSDAASFLLTSRASADQDARGRQAARDHHRRALARRCLGLAHAGHQRHAWHKVQARAGLHQRPQHEPRHGARRDRWPRHQQSERRCSRAAARPAPDGRPLFNFLLQWGLKQEPGLSGGAAAERSCHQRRAEGGVRFRRQGRVAGAPDRDQCRTCRPSGSRRCAAPSTPP